MQRPPRQRFSSNGVIGNFKRTHLKVIASQGRLGRRSAEFGPSVDAKIKPSETCTNGKGKADPRKTRRTESRLRPPRRDRRRRHGPARLPLEVPSVLRGVTPAFHSSRQARTASPRESPHRLTRSHYCHHH